MYCRLRAEKTQTTRGFKNFFHMRLIYLRPFLHGCNTIRYHYRASGYRAFTPFQCKKIQH